MTDSSNDRAKVELPPFPDPMTSFLFAPMTRKPADEPESDALSQVLAEDETDREVPPAAEDWIRATVRRGAEELWGPADGSGRELPVEGEG